MLHLGARAERAEQFAQQLAAAIAFKKFADAQGHPPIADSLSSMVLALPMHHGLSDEQIKQVGEALNKVAAAYRV